MLFRFSKCDDAIIRIIQFLEKLWIKRVAVLVSIGAQTIIASGEQVKRTQ